MSRVLQLNMLSVLSRKRYEPLRAIDMWREN